MNVPETKILEFAEVSGALGDEEMPVVSVMIRVFGEVNGMLLLILEEGDAFRLIKLLTQSEISSLEEIDEVSLSAIREIGNILCGTYMTALATMTGLDLRCDYPEVNIDMAGAIMNIPASLMGEFSDNVLYVDSGFIEGQDSLKAHIFLVPEGNHFKTILQSLGVHL